MLAKLRIKNGIYPLISLASSLLILFSGLLMVGGDWFSYFFILVFFIYISFGYAKTMFLVMIIFLPVSLIAGIITYLGSGFHDAVSNIWRILLLGMGAVLTVSIEPADLVRNLNQLKVPRYLTTGILISLRFVPVLAEEFRRIRLAMRLRGINAGIYRPTILYRAFFIPLIMRLMSISDTLTVSLETRAFTIKEEVTSYKIIFLKLKDLLFAALILLLVSTGLILTFLVK